MEHYLVSALVPLGLFFSILLFLSIGRHLGLRRRAKYPERESSGIGAVDSAIFGLMGLLLAFTFSGAAARFDIRRNLIVQEANIIGTAYLRLDLLKDPSRVMLQGKFREYLDSRISSYRQLPNISAAQVDHSRSLQLQGEIWRHAVAATEETGSPATVTLVLSALN